MLPHHLKFSIGEEHGCCSEGLRRALQYSVYTVKGSTEQQCHTRPWQLFSLDAAMCVPGITTIFLVSSQRTPPPVKRWPSIPV